MSDKSVYFNYVLTKGLLSSIIAVLFVMVGIVAYQTLPFAAVFNVGTLFGNLVVVALVFFLLTYALHSVIDTKIKSSTAVVALIAFMIFASIEVFNIILSLLTHSTYYPSNPTYYSNFWLSRGINLVLSFAATGIVAYITKADLNKLYK